MQFHRLKVPAVVAAALLTHGAVAAAQCTPGGPPNLPARRGALLGVVMDSTHRVIEGAEVFTHKPGQRARSGAYGRFVLDSLSPGIYTISVRRIGYEMAVQDYQVPDSGGHARFCLVPDATRLIPMITSAKRLGLGGVIGDSTYEPLYGAEVRAVAAAERAITDSAGGFFIPLRPGTYPIIVSKPGYGRQLLSVTIPKDSGREIAVWLGSPARNPNRMAAAYFDMRGRIQVANANRSAIRSSEELARVSVDLLFAAQSAIRYKLPPDCAAVIDGGPFTLPLASIPKEDVAMMEMYLNKAPRPSVTMNPGGTRGGATLSTVRAPTGGCGAVDVYVWLK